MSHTPSLVRWQVVGDDSTGESTLVARVLSDRIELEQAQELEPLLCGGGPRPPGTVVLDLEEVSYIASSGVSLLVRVAAERRLRVCCVQPSVRQVMEAIGIMSLLREFDSTAEALADARAG